MKGGEPTAFLAHSACRSRQAAALGLRWPKVYRMNDAFVAGGRHEASSRNVQMAIGPCWSRHASSSISGLVIALPGVYFTSVPLSLKVYWRPPMVAVPVCMAPDSLK